MGNIGLPELLIVLVIALVVFGPKRLPQMGRQLGQTIREFRTATSDIRSQIGLDDIADSVKDLKSGLSLTGDTPAASPAATDASTPPGTAAPSPAVIGGPETVAPAAVTAAVTGAALAQPAAAAATPADEPAAEPDAGVGLTGAENGALAAPSAPSAPEPVTAPQTAAVQGDVGVESFGKLKRSAAPAATSTPAD